jgi:flagellar assembly factor FliW
MEILTRDYGTVEIDKSAIIHFDNGLIGFEEYRDYVLLDIFPNERDSPFRCLQSLDERGLAFILINPFSVKPDYEISLDETIVKRLYLEDADIGNNVEDSDNNCEGSIVIMVITVIPEDITKMSFNLKAPLVINANIRKGEQYIVDNPKYKVRHYLSEENN